MAEQLPEDLRKLHADLTPLRQRLQTHPVYTLVNTAADLRVFLESHVFAVWDFMSLLKSLQRALTCVEVPWTPGLLPASRRFINEIVLGEESDLYEGRPLSHFEIYLEAMTALDADTAAIVRLVQSCRDQSDWKAALHQAPKPARSFVHSTFHIIESGNLAAQAAAFTFGREDVIPEMFRELVHELDRESNGRLGPFVWYLERHIDVDGDEHGPLALKMVADICGESAKLWQEAADGARQALEARIRLWDGIAELIRQTRPPAGS